MPARSLTTQGFYLQRETTPGTAVTTAMKRYLGIKGEMGYEIEKEYFRASGYKADTGENILTEMGSMDLEVTQDYNAMLPLLSGVFGAPVTTMTAASGGATPATPAAYEHVFTIDPKAADELVTYTAMWGDPVLALQALAMAFHSLTIGVQRTELSLSAGAILRAPKTGIALPTTGITEVPMIPVRASTYDVSMDSTYANIGTTKLLALYNIEYDYGDKLVPDWVVNSALDSYSELMEADDIDYGMSATVGFDPTAVGLINDSLAGGMKFVRTSCTGPSINGTDAYAFDIDAAVRLNPGSVTSGPDSPATVVEFEGRMQVDGESGFLSSVRLVNALPGL